MPLFRSAVVALALLGAAASAKSPQVLPGSLTYKPSKLGDDEDRPVVVKASLRPQGSDFVLQMEFNKAPWGESCKTRCANATFLIDTDDDPSTGMQQGNGKAPTGTDLAVIVQGLKDYGGDKGSSASYVKVKVRSFGDEDRVLEDGDTVADLDHRYDKERVETDGKEIRVLIDASSGTLPVGKTCRFVYLPPTTKPISVKCTGMGGDVDRNGKVDVIRGQAKGHVSKPKETQPEWDGKKQKLPPAPVRQVDPRWGAGG